MLLADFHIHTTWSDGKLSMGEVVDLFGRSGHDVIAITDHVVNRDNTIGAVTHRIGLSVSEERFPDYLAEIEHERRRAWDRYRMIVIPGCELTRNTFRRANSAHALAIGVDRYVSPEGSVEEMLVDARAADAAVVACHPNEQSEWFANTFYLWRRREEVAGLIDRWEIACRHDLFPPVSRARLPYIANSDFHDVPHLGGWKTLMPCEKTERSVMRALKDGRDFAVTRLAFEPRPERVPESRPGLQLAPATG